MWGQLTIIDLSECEEKFLKDKRYLEVFFSELCKKIEVEAVGKPLIKRCGTKEFEGISGVQLIETSSISVHLDEVGKRAFIDIFSCKKFDKGVVEEFSKEYFKPKGSKSRTIIRE